MEKIGGFQAWLKIVCSNFFIMPLKIGSDSRNEKSGCPCSNHRVEEVGRDPWRSPSPNHSITVIFSSTSQVNMYFLFPL